MNTKTQITILIGAAYALIACSGVTDLPAIQPVPHTADGATQAANSTFTLFTETLGKFMSATGVFTDELTTASNGSAQALDTRHLDETNPGDSTGVYSNLQDVRVAANVAERSIVQLLPDAPSDMRGRLYAIQGYSEVMLADLFCSGIPLSTINLANAEVIYQPALPRDSVYRRAVTHFDSALALSTANDSLMTLARVGKGRALLALGQFSEAAQAVASVPDGASYIINIPLSVPTGATGWETFSTNRVADHEGQTGLAYLSSQDPRTAAIVLSGTTNLSVPRRYVIDSLVHHPNPAAYVQFVVADWVEARLIQAEAALQANNATTWLQTLNDLRTNVASLTTSHGIYPSVTLAALADPGTTSARVDTMFAERAAWLYLTGHRQGDLRRLMRQYGRPQDQVYPNGTYARGGTYGMSVTAPVPASERSNPQFDGCLDRQP